jgi:hypothetical protein
MPHSPSFMVVDLTCHHQVAVADAVAAVVAVVEVVAAATTTAGQVLVQAAAISGSAMKASILVGWPVVLQHQQPQQAPRRMVVLACLSRCNRAPQSACVSTPAAATGWHARGSTGWRGIGRGSPTGAAFQ